jgi:hypothetical protein
MLEVRSAEAEAMTAKAAKNVKLRIRQSGIWNLE